MIWGATDTVVWWGFIGDAATAPIHPWTALEQVALNDKGIELDKPAHAILRQVHAWRHPVLLARKRVVLVVPRARNGQATAAHPLWHEIQAGFRAAGGTDCLTQNAGAVALAPAVNLIGHRITRIGAKRRIQPEPRRNWFVEAGLVEPRNTESFSSLERLITCPFSWLLHYRGKLRSGALLSLPGDDQLVGVLAHAVVERMVATKKDWPPAQAADEAAKLFDRMAPAIAAPLLRAGNAVEYGRAREKVVDAVRTLMQLIASAGLSVDGAEVAATVPFEQGNFTGSIDLLLRDQSGRAVILDLK
jgi:hypothetical protein